MYTPSVIITDEIHPQKKTLFFVAFGRWAREMDGRFVSASPALSDLLAPYKCTCPWFPLDLHSKGRGASKIQALSLPALPQWPSSLHQLQHRSSQPLHRPSLPWYRSSWRARRGMRGIVRWQQRLHLATWVEKLQFLALRYWDMKVVSRYSMLFPYHDILIGPPTSWLILICRYCGSE